MTSFPKARRWAVVAVLALAMATPLGAQSARYAIETRASLAWWQMNPHFNHLWATTCPSDPTWQAGEGRSPGYYFNQLTRHEASDVRMDNRIPLYPRKRIRYVCRQAVHGVIDVDMSTWDVKGNVSVLADSLVTGLDMRDLFARRAIFSTDQYPSIRFAIDSLSDKRMTGDTLTARAVGTFELRGHRKSMSVPLKAWPEGGGMRVQTQMQIDPKTLTHDYGMSKASLGMGVTMNQWKELHFGIDVLLMKAETPPAQPAREPSGTE